MWNSRFFVVALSVSFVDYVLTLENGLARTPPMGWLSWERYGCELDCNAFPDACISEKLYKDMADKLVELGLSDLGYKYVNVDDCWSKLQREPSGELKEDPIRFPSGMQWLSDYVHSKNLLFGIYTDIGTNTCGGYPGLGDGFGAKDIAMFTGWKIDSLKVDGCYAEVKDMKSKYSELAHQLNATGRPILYSCSWPAYQSDHCENPSDMQALIENCNLWRNYVDIEDSWWSVRSIANFWARGSDSDLMVSSAGPGHWNDPDMLMVGNPGLSISEQKTQFYLWAILAAPLYISSDLRTISEDSLAILKNAEAIAINQDPLGMQGFVVMDDPSRRIWIRHLQGARIAVLFENKATIFERKRFVLDIPSHLKWTKGTYSVRDIDTHTDVVSHRAVSDQFVVDVDESSVRFFVFEKNDVEEESSIVVVIQ
jgi:alpha-N-acetylgalactosaminidase